MLPPRSPIQKTKTLNPDDQKIFSTYQDEYTNGKNHGNLVAHYGNSAYLNLQPAITSKKSIKPFLSPSYQNLTSDSYICNKVSDNYSNNYRTSHDNLLQRPIHTAPARTKLNHLLDIKVAPIAKLDKPSIYEQDYLFENVNDHFVSKRWIKTETINLRDTIASLRELGDYMRNKSYDVNQRKSFSTDTNGLNQLDICGQLFSKLNSYMEILLLSYNKLNSNSVELKRNSDNLVYAQNVIDRNLWDRSLKPSFERDVYKSTEDSINKDKIVLNQQKSLANKVLKEAQTILTSIESFTYKNLEEIFEEAKVIIMHKLHNKQYEISYLRDSNGYIKKDAKLPMKMEDWFSLTNRGLQTLESLVKKADKMTQTVIDTINKIGENASNQWINTHDVGVQQVENGLKIQSNLINTQYDLNREIDQIGVAIKDTKAKLGTCKMFDEVYLTQLETKLSEIDPYYEEHRLRQGKHANQIWSNANDLKDNLDKMIQYKKILQDRRQRLDKNIHSNHSGLNYDLKTIVDPRRFNIATNPSVDLVLRSSNSFN